MARPDVPDFLTQPLDLLVVGGKGGVGKTTCAVATALRRACREDVLLLSTDPAHSLRDSLADDVALPDRLTVEEFDTDAALADFRTTHREMLGSIVDRGTLLDAEDVERLLDLSLPGMDEVMAFLRLADLLSDPDAPLVVLDTAPTGHTVRLLDTPDQFLRWVGFLDILLDKHRTMRSVFGRHRGPDVYDAFLDDLRSRAETVRTALADAARCQFVVVTRAEPIVLSETDALIDTLRTRDVPVRTSVVNAWPDATAPDAPAHHAALRSVAEDSTLFGTDVWTLPRTAEEVQGIERLTSLLAGLAPLDLSDLPSSSDTDDPRPVPSVLDPLPSPLASLVLVAGKGGVGKTTMACATALHRTPGRTLLVSTDPAHSIGPALGISLSDTPTPVTDRLDAVEVDAAGRFDALRDDYAEEVGRFFQRTGGPNVDLTYDRRVMQGLMDLAPPGMDEVMGWIAAMDFLDGNRYDACVIDSAPTGHFVRLLEMPDLFRDWLRVFFRILQKHKHVARLPDLSDRLVRLSKQVRRFRTMQAEGDAVVLGVTLPAEMALEETRDLYAAADRLSVPVPALVVNRLPDAPDVAAAWLDRVRDAFPGCRVAGVSDGRPPSGTDALAALGARLYAS